ncbi:MAG: hypothetical protein ACPGFC_12590, partial [Paracoccaceae bacterium]
MANHTNAEETTTEEQTGAQTGAQAGADTTAPANEGTEELTEAANEILSVGQSLLMQGEALLTSLLRPWNAYQIGIALAVFVAAQLMRVWLGPKVRGWMASREGWPTWRMRVLVVVHQRLRWIFFVGLIWLVVAVMREATWPSRSY